MPSNSLFPRPLEWVAAAAVASKTVIPMALDRSSLWNGVAKEELKLGDHIYVWKSAFAYSHHGIVVHVEACKKECHHPTPHCCAVVHFLPPGDGRPFGRIAMTSLAVFSEGAAISRCQYGATQAEFYLKRAGVCSTHVPDPWPVAVIRALSLVDTTPLDMPGHDGPRAEDPGVVDLQVEYGMLTKNCELLARWCCLGPASGVQRFRSAETAFSPQTAPARFVRLGLAAAVGGGAVAAVVAASPANAPVAGCAAAAAGAASPANGPSAPLLTVGGTLAASAVRDLLLDCIRSPERAARLLSQNLPTRVRSSSGASRSADVQYPAAGLAEGPPDALRACLEHLGVTVPPQLDPLLDWPWGSGRLCEMFVDVVEHLMPSNSFEIAAAIQSFLDDLSA